MARWGNSRGDRSLKRVAEVLACVGFNAKLAGEIRRWYRKIADPKKLAKIDGRKEVWGRFAKDLTKDQNRAFGLFVNEMMEAAFVSGVRIGLATRLFDPTEPTESDEEDHPKGGPQPF